MYQRLFADLRETLAPGGLCAVEIGAAQGQAVLQLARPLGAPRLIQDLAGRDRVVAIGPTLQPAPKGRG